MKRVLILVPILAVVVACNDRRRAEPATTAEAPAAPATLDPPRDEVLAARAPAKEPDVIYVPTPQARVDRMLELADLEPGDKLYDLGCGDGRIAVTAAREYGARAVCVDIDPERIAEARANVRAAGVEDLVEVRQGDLFEVDLSDADVVTLYLLERLNLKLRPTLRAQLRPGARVVSHAFDMGDWEPDVREEVDGGDVYLWVIPER